jgi:hypothetical protein
MRDRSVLRKSVSDACDSEVEAFRAARSLGRALRVGDTKVQARSPRAYLDAWRRSYVDSDKAGKV